MALIVGLIGGLFGIPLPIVLLFIWWRWLGRANKEYAARS